MHDYILEYYQGIKDGSICVGQWITKLYDYIVKGRESGLFLFDIKKANRAIKFIETFCHHSDGRNDLIKLELWQKALVSCVFGLVDEDGNRHFREIVVVMGRKNGKTLLASALILAHLFMDYLQAGDEYGKKVFCVAPKLDQADIIYNAIWQTIEAEPELKALIKRRKSDYYIESTNSSVKKIASNSKKSDGFNPSFVVMDECASFVGDAGLKQWEVMASAVGSRREPILLGISTSGYVNDGIYDELIKRSTHFLLGNSKETRLLPFLYMIDDIKKWNDINELKKSNPNMGVSIPASFLVEEINKAESSLSKFGEFITKYANLKSNSSSAWIPNNVVETAFGDPLKLEDFRGCYCVGGIDLSQTTDLTACCVVIEKGGKLYVFSKFFLPSERLDTATERDGVPYWIYVKRGLLQPSGQSFVDYNDVYNWFTTLVRDYEIYPLKVGYDRYSSTYLVNQMSSSGFHMDDVYQGDNLWGVMQETQGLLEEGRFNCGDNDLLKIHFLDSAVKMSNERGRGRLVKVSPKAHIDGMASLLDAMTMRSKYFNEIGEQLKNGT